MYKLKKINSLCIPLVVSQKLKQGLTAEDVTHFGHRICNNQVGTEPETSLQRLLSHCVQRCHASGQEVGAFGTPSQL